MRLLNRKSQLQRLLDTLTDSLDAPSGMRLGLPSGIRSGLPNRIKLDLPSVDSGKALKAGLIAAGGLAGLTAGSAGISSLRRRTEGARDDS
jgi:hypothetical protein